MDNDKMEKKQYRVKLIDKVEFNYVQHYVNHDTNTHNKNNNNIKWGWCNQNNLVEKFISQF